MTRRIPRLMTMSALALLGLPPLQSAAKAPAVRLPLWPEGSIAAGKESGGDPAVPTVDVHMPDPGKATGCVDL